MARRLFFVPEVSRSRAELRGEEAKHLTRVLRVEAGQKYEISDNHSLYLAEVDTARKDLVSFRVLEKLERPVPGISVTLLASLVKFDRFEWIVEKATELGVAAIVPIEAERSERGLEKAAVKRMERWNRIATESSQQSRRAVLPVLEEPVSFEIAIRRPAAVRLFLDESPGTKPLLASLPEAFTPADPVALLVGPEGGWVGSEREAAVSAGWIPVSLGPQILRAETAVIACLAVINALWQARRFEQHESM